jgi:hypothetical protein
MTTPLFAQSRVSCLTREEECLLKTALAMVVIKKRKLQKDMEDGTIHHNQDDDDNEGKFTRTKVRKVSSSVDDTTTRKSTGDKSKLPLTASPLESLFNSSNKKKVPSRTTTTGSPSTSSSSPLLNSPNRVHIDQMFQVARSMAITSSGQPTGEARNPALAGTASHLAQQLQVWAQHEQHEEPARSTQPQDHRTTTRDESSASSSSASSSTVLVVKDWIRSRLTALEQQGPRSNFVVFEAIIQQATDETFVSTVLSIVVKILRDLYYDEFLVASPSSSNLIVSRTTTSKKKTPSSTSLDRLATLSLQLVYTCLDWYNNKYNSEAQAQAQARHRHRYQCPRSGRGGIQVLYECLAGDEELLVPLPFSRLPKAYVARKSPCGGLDPGAKLLLRLTLYRCLLQFGKHSQQHHHHPPTRR